MQHSYRGYRLGVYSDFRNELRSLKTISAFIEHPLAAAARSISSLSSIGSRTFNCALGLRAMSVRMVTRFLIMQSSIKNYRQLALVNRSMAINLSFSPRILCHPTSSSR